MALALLDLSFDYPEYSNTENQRHTKENFEKLINYLKSLDDTDSIAKLINKSFRKNRKINFKSPATPIQILEFWKMIPKESILLSDIDSKGR